MFRLGYNTNGLAHHRLADALPLLAELGYEAVAITPDVGQLDPLRLDAREVEEVRRLSRELGLALAVETGGRYLLDPRRKHFPTLLEDDPAQRARRLDLLRRTVDLAAELESDVVSIWSGAAPRGVSADGADGIGLRETVWERLCAGLRGLLAHACERGVRLAFEPEPGMFIERPAGFQELVGRLGPEGRTLGLTLDVGHLLCTGDLPVAEVVREHAPRLSHVHLDDVVAGVHEHRMFGEGDLDLASALNALLEVGYRGIAAVELSRDSYRGASAAQQAMTHLRAALAQRP